MPGPGSIYSIAEKYRKQLLAGERAVATEMMQYYGEAWKRLKVSLDDIVNRIEEARKEGKEVSPAWLYQDDRYRAFMRQVEAEMTRFSRFAEETVVKQQAEAMNLAHFAVRNVTLYSEEEAALTASWMQAPTAAVEAAIGFMQPRSPLHKLFARLPGNVTRSIERELVVAVATGTGPAQTARRIRKALGGNAARALTISRSETLRAYREATHQDYLANKDILEGWEWVSAKSARTCVACLAMDGTVHKLSERLDDHPAGRCVSAPLLRGVPRPDRKTGEEWFTEQAPDVQKKILGNAGYEAYRNGTVILQDFVGQKHDREWGTMRYARSLRDALKEASRHPRPINLASLAPGATLTEDQVKVFGARMNEILADTMGLPTRWNGNTVFEPMNPGVWGKAHWDGTIGLSDTISMYPDDVLPTLLHELVHHYSVGMDITSYGNYTGWEEGVVQGATEALWGQISVSLGKRMVVGVPSYFNYTVPLQQLATLLHADEKTFFMELLQTPLPRRRAKVAAMGRSLPAIKQPAWRQLVQRARKALG